MDKYKLVLVVIIFFIGFLLGSSCRTSKLEKVFKECIYLGDTKIEIMSCFQDFLDYEQEKMRLLN